MRVPMASIYSHYRPPAATPQREVLDNKVFDLSPILPKEDSNLVLFGKTFKVFFLFHLGRSIPQILMAGNGSDPSEPFPPAALTPLSSCLATMCAVFGGFVL